MVRNCQFQCIAATRLGSNFFPYDNVGNLIFNMSSGTRILFGFAALFGGLLILALLREQFVTSAVFGFSLLLSLGAEALWLVGEKQKKHR